ncbi:DUF7504 family protein [Natronosalvus halobius]|uniref:DUF7504 family protein n=1 Tax=Natronosalvus halobius TaxID=2953746 RepID=UPI00209E7549|nr:hypothetical protein [Natronosalvus halobius]USZ71373.1 hypothetical protein NGM15_15030 [Natronosalvus halobius]
MRNILLMFSGKDCRNGTTERAFADELSRLKRRGASVLVTGVVQADQRQVIARRLLGTAPEEIRKRIVISTPGTEFDIDRLVDDVDSGNAEIVSYQGTARSVSAETAGTAGTTETAKTTEAAGTKTPSTPSTPGAKAPVTTAETLGDVGIAVSSAIERFERNGDLEPGVLRVGIDSLVPFLEEYGREAVFQYLHLLNGRTRAAGGIAHYHLPIERDSSTVSILTPLFDVVVELRERNGIVQERWSLTESDLSTGWVPITQ